MNVIHLNLQIFQFTVAHKISLHSEAPTQVGKVLFHKSNYNYFWPKQGPIKVDCCFHWFSFKCKNTTLFRTVRMEKNPNLIIVNPI